MRGVGDVESDLAAGGDLFDGSGSFSAFTTQISRGRSSHPTLAQGVPEAARERILAQKDLECPPSWLQ